MCDIIFGKAKGRGRKVNRVSVYTEAAVQMVFQKRCYEKFRRNTFLAEQLWTTASHCGSINSSKGSTVKPNCELRNKN